jgi:hypothetical protein
MATKDDLCDYVLFLGVIPRRKYIFGLRTMKHCYTSKGNCVGHYVVLLFIVYFIIEKTHYLKTLLHCT